MPLAPGRIKVFEHLRGHAHAALQQFAKLAERGGDVLLPDTFYFRSPAGPLELLEPLPLGRKLPPHLLGPSRQLSRHPAR